MKSYVAFVIILAAFFLNNAIAADTTQISTTGEHDDEVGVSPNTGNIDANTVSAKNVDFCFFSGIPPSEIKYTVIRKLKVAKGTYGGVKDILPRLVDRARNIGADAMIQYTGSQRFGFFPWRTVRPVVRGVAIKWDNPQKPNCAGIGGTTLKTILDTDKPPAQ